MRADRLLSLVMLLQTRGKMTAQALAEELGVSRRTILRDVDASTLFAGRDELEQSRLDGSGSV